MVGPGKDFVAICIPVGFSSRLSPRAGLAFDRFDSHTCFFLSFSSFCVFGDVAFSEYRYFLYHCRFLFVYGEYVVRSFLSNGVFLPCDHGLDF